MKWDVNIYDNYILLREDDYSNQRKTMLIEKNKWCCFLSLDYICNWAALGGVYLGSGSDTILEISL